MLAQQDTASAAPEAYERAPTLMAGASAGTQGAVQVWSPSRRLLWATAIGGGAVLLCLIAVAVRNHTLAVPWAALAALGSVILAADSLRRPSYITTDDAGMAVTTRKGARALSWSDVEAVDLIPGRQLTLHAPERIEVSTSGYPRTTEIRLLELIASRAKLEREDGCLNRYVRPRSGPEIPPRWISPDSPNALAAGSGITASSLPPVARLGVTFTEAGTPSIASVTPGSPAAQAGLQRGDQIVVMNQLTASSEAGTSDASQREITFQITVRRAGLAEPLDFRIRV